MGSSAPILALVSLLLVVPVLAFERRQERWGVALFKPLASAAFVVCGVAGGAAATTYGRWVLVGLALGWLGDVLLVSRRRRPFLAGLVSFLLSHLGYAAAFLAVGVAWPWAVGAAVVLGPVAGAVHRWLWPHLGSMRPAVTAYVVVISVMVALGVGAWAADGAMVLLVAPVAFFLSDLAVARDRFVAPGFVNRLWGLPLYYLSQVLFALSPGWVG